MPWPFTWTREKRIAEARAAILPLLIENGREPNREGKGSSGTWLIPATDADAAKMLDEIAEAAIDAQRYPLP
jgi:hypothetical protein